MKTICKVIWDKTIDHKSCGTILEGAPHEKCGECAKVKINAFQFQVTFVSRWKSSIKKGEVDFYQGVEGKGLP